MASTTAWAEEAGAHLETYIRRLVSSSSNPLLANSCFFFGSAQADDLAYAMFRSFLGPSFNIMHLPPSSDIFSVFDEQRTWKPLLSRLPSGCADPRLLTMLRVDASSAEIHAPGALLLVPRAQWAVVELARTREGCYDDESTMMHALRESAARAGYSLETSAGKEGQRELIGPSHLAVHGSFDDADRSGGRKVLAKRDIQAGETFLEARPLAVAPFDVSSGVTCFHCGVASDDTAAAAAPLVPLVCTTCFVEAFAFCSAACQRKHEAFHRRECPLLRPVLEAAEATRGVVAPFKAVLVLRAALRAAGSASSGAAAAEEEAKEEEEEAKKKELRGGGWRALRALQVHRNAHESEAPDYARATRQLSATIAALLPAEVKGAIVSDGDGSDDSDGSECVTDVLQDVFFAININAIGVSSDGGCGLFPGLPSMLNHSCVENATHSFDADGLLRCRAVRAVAAGEELLFSYVGNEHLRTLARTAPLRKHKFFVCACERCTAGDEDDDEDEEEGGRGVVCDLWPALEAEVDKCSTAADVADVAAAEAAEAARREGSGSEQREAAARRRACEANSQLVVATRKLAVAAEAIYATPSSAHVAKGLQYERLARSLVRAAANEEDSARAATYATEGVAAAEAAAMNYKLCRGEDSPLLARVAEILECYHHLRRDGGLSGALNHEEESGEEKQAVLEGTLATGGDSTTDEDPEKTDITTTPWTEVVLEIKTWEPRSSEDLEELRKRIVSMSIVDTSSTREATPLEWSDNYRLCELGYSIRSLVVSCSFNEAAVGSCEALADQLVGGLEEDVQSIDVCCQRQSQKRANAKADAA